MTSQEALYGRGRSSLSEPSHFKKHKVLPHPKKDKAQRNHNNIIVRLPSTHNDSGAFSRSSERLASQAWRMPTLRHHSKRIGDGPDMPPTPPAHSRSSSSSQSIVPSSPTCVATPEESLDNVTAPDQPTTPPNRQSPPTPELTPPGLTTTRRPPPRPILSQRMRTQTADTATTRTESYMTAPEYPFSDDGRSERSGFHCPPLFRTSQSLTTREIQETCQSSGPTTPQPAGLEPGLELSLQEDNDKTPKANEEQIFSFTSKPSPHKNTQRPEEDRAVGRPSTRQRISTKPLIRDNLNRIQTDIIENDTATPITATETLMSMSKPPINNEMESKRVSVLSTKSTVSTVVEAILVDASPQRRKTLRHTRKAGGLRDSSSETPTASSCSSSHNRSTREADCPRSSQKTPRDRRHDSMNSNATGSSISNRRARNDILRNGGVPVVIIPERHSSVKSNRPQSLRSMSSRRSKRSNSVCSAPLSSLPRSKDLVPFEQSSWRTKVSGSDSSDSQRTVDYPPVVPVRTSSLSAPTSRNTSRNTSRAGSLTAESLEAYSAFQEGIKNENREFTPGFKLEQAATVKKSEHKLDEDNCGKTKYHCLNVDSNGDPFFGRRHSIHKTPFSQASIETNGTCAAEVSEALVVNIYSHQNSSIVMVDHFNKPLDTPTELVTKSACSIPKVVATDMEGGVPVTPPQPGYSLYNVESPLRNPRAPPEPPVAPVAPAIALIPATPSGMTPVGEKEHMLGNLYDELNDKPIRPSLIRRALSLRRNYESSRAPSFLRSRRISDDGQDNNLLTRTFSLSRNPRRSTSEQFPIVNSLSKEQNLSEIASEYPTEDKTPPDETKLHPFWRPHYFDSDEEDDWDCEMDEGEERGSHNGYYRYPPIDNRPLHPRRSISSRLKKTFAILPIERKYPVSYESSHDRRTIQRTASGNLRVLKVRRSLDSLRYKHDDMQSKPHQAGGGIEALRPYTASHRSSTLPSRIQSLKHKGRLLTGVSQYRRSGITKTRPPSTGHQASLRRSTSNLKALLGEYSMHALPRRFNERRREKRSAELRGKISSPQEVRDGVGDIIRRSSLIRQSFQA